MQNDSSRRLRIEELLALGEAICMELLRRLKNAGVERAATILEQAPVGHLVGQRVRERVLEVIATTLRLD